MGTPEACSQSESRVLTPPSALETFKAAALAAGRANTDADFLHEAVHQLAALVGAHRCSILLIEDRRLRHGAAIGLSDAYLEAIDGLEIGPDVGTCGTAGHTGEPYITADIESDPRWNAFRDLARAEGLRACWSVPLKLPDGRIVGTFATYADKPFAPTIQQVELAQAHAAIVALGLDRISRQQEISESYESVVLALVSAMDSRDEYTASHSAATATLAHAVAEALGIEGADLRRIDQVALLHDIGKLGVPSEILRSPDPLAPEQAAVMRQHPVVGEQILSQVPFLREVATAVRGEHERWDGTGYPDGLAGEQIPLAARIVFACDAYHAMTSDRPYRPALPHEEAIAELRQGAGSQFDPRVVQVLLEELGEEAPPMLEAPREAEGRERQLALAELADALGADDLLIFRRISPDVFSHLGGVGRGEGWAGNIELRSREERHFLAALERGQPHRLELSETGRIVGPYYGRSAVIVPCPDDVVVVFGSSSDALRGAATAEAARLARRASAIVQEVSAAKRLADEIEVLDAVRATTTVAADGVEATLCAIADRAAAALSCEFGAVVLAEAGTEPRLGWADRGWTPTPRDDLREALAGFAAEAKELPLLIQDADEQPAAAPSLARSPGLSSIHALPIGSPLLAVLVVAHAEPVPRGFTALCQRVARAVSEAAEVVVRRTLAQEQLTAENADLARRVRTDALTGVASRAAWEETLEREELHRARSGAEIAVAIFDVDGLKQVNDRFGHLAGDALLRTCARILASNSRATDFVARIGGDEFGVLLRYSDENSARAWCERVHRAVRESHGSGPPMSVSAGYACAPPQPSVASACEQADAQMYAARAERRAAAS
ncbi:MAG TPA: HD domain-containing phosphohydrolase [Solirubrobacteraceae bacterium]|nr:HD domain-containing phosphohydrolase [Solirubrobacteraceae bacterium]